MKLDTPDNSTDSIGDYDDQVTRQFSERHLTVKVLGQLGNERRVSFWNRLRGKDEKLLGSCQVDLWVAATGPLHHNLCVKDSRNRDTQFRIEFQAKVVVRKCTVFRLRDVAVDLQSGDGRDVDGGCKQDPEPYVVVSFVGTGKPMVVSQEKLIPTRKPRWSYLPALEVPALSVSDLVSGYLLVKVHDTRNSNHLLTQFKLQMYLYWGCLISQGREMKVRVKASSTRNVLTASLAVETAPHLCQMRGGVHSDGGITDGRPLIFGVPLPLSRRRDDTVWGTRMPVLQGWIELLDSFGNVYYHNVANNLNSWLEPGESDVSEIDGHGSHWETFFGTLPDGNETWIHPRARTLQQLTLTSASSRSLRLLPGRGNTRSDVVPTAGPSSSATSNFSILGRHETSISDHSASNARGAIVAGDIQFPKLVDEGGILTDMRWTSLDSIFARRLLPAAGTEGHSLSTIDNGKTLLKFGGAGSGGYKNNDLFAFDIRELLWRPIQASGVAPTPRTGHGAATLCNGSRLLIFGGASRRGRLKDLHVLDTECWKWSPVLPTSRVSPEPRARLGMTAMSNGTSTILFGGREGYRYLGDRYYNDVWVFDAYRTEWLNIKPNKGKEGPAARSGCVVEMINGRQLFVHAGYDDGDKFYDDTWLLDTVSWSWQQLPYPNEPQKPIAREGHASTILGDTVFIYGGDRESGGFLGDVNMFDTGSLRWAGEPSTTGSSPGGRCGAAIAPVDSHRLLVVGGDNGYRMVADTHTLDTTYTAKAEVAEVTERARREGPHASSCIICLDGPVETVFLWCGHFVCCRGCASRVKNTCPLCRRWISKVSLIE